MEQLIRLQNIDTKLKDLNDLSKFLSDPGDTNVNIIVRENNKNLNFKLEKGRKLDRKTVNLIRNREILTIIN